MNSYSYSGSTNLDPNVAAGMGAVFGAMMFVWVIVVCAVSVIMIISMWKIFTKAGKPGWASIVPIYNIITLFKIVGLNPYLIFLYLTLIIPPIGAIVAIVLGIMSAVKLTKAFGEEGAFAVGLIFLPIIFYPILAFGKAKYVLNDTKPADPVSQDSAPQAPVAQEPVSDNTDNSAPQI